MNIIPEITNILKAGSSPFHVVDCHIANHSPPTVMKYPNQISMLISRPFIAVVFPILFFANIWYAPFSRNSAARASVMIIIM